MSSPLLPVTPMMFLPNYERQVLSTLGVSLSGSTDTNTTFNFMYAPSGRFLMMRQTEERQQRVLGQMSGQVAYPKQIRQQFPFRFLLENACPSVLISVQSPPISVSLCFSSFNPEISSSRLSRFSLLLLLAEQYMQARPPASTSSPAMPILVIPSQVLPSISSSERSAFRFFCSCIIQASCLLRGCQFLLSENGMARKWVVRTVGRVSMGRRDALRAEETILLIILIINVIGMFIIGNIDARNKIYIPSIHIIINNILVSCQSAAYTIHKRIFSMMIASQLVGKRVLLPHIQILQKQQIFCSHMPPKKKQEKQDQKILWGRPANTLRMGIVGLPNVGKSTTYNVLSNLNVPAENYPFCTIDPNKAVVPVPDDRFRKLCDMYHPKSEVAAVLQIVDIAGIVRGASKGEGLGNHFLSNIKDVDGIYHVVRAFEDEEITHTENSVDPLRDMDIINTELVLKDLEYVTNRLQDLEKVIKRTNPKDAREEKEILVKVLDLLQKNKWVRHGDWSNAEIAVLNTHRLITAKTVVYLVNLSEDDFVTKKNKWLKKIKEWIDANVPGEIIPYSAEHERKELENKDEKKRTMIPKIIKAGYNALDLIYFFTAGTDEVRCWTIRKLTKAPQAAGVIHTDFEKGFICAEIMKYDDLVALGSEQAVKAEGKYVQKGKDYVVEDGDIILFRFNVGKGK